MLYVLIVISRKEEQFWAVSVTLFAMPCVSDCVKVRSQFHMLNAHGQSPSKSDPLVLCKPLKQLSFASGHLIIKPRGVKTKQYIRNDTMVCPLLLWKRER